MTQSAMIRPLKFIYLVLPRAVTFISQGLRGGVDNGALVMTKGASPSYIESPT